MEINFRVLKENPRLEELKKNAMDLAALLLTAASPVLSTFMEK